MPVKNRATTELTAKVVDPNIWLDDLIQQIS